MNLYRTTGVGPAIWAASQGAAASARKTMISERGAKRADVATVPVEIDTRKAELVAFLNNLENGVVRAGGGE